MENGLNCGLRSGIIRKTFLGFKAEKYNFVIGIINRINIVTNVHRRFWSFGKCELRVSGLTSQIHGMHQARPSEESGLRPGIVRPSKASSGIVIVK